MGWAILIGGAVVSFWYNGPCFGVLTAFPFAVLAYPAEKIWKHYRRAGRLDGRGVRRAWLGGGVIAAAVAAHLMFKPPSGQAILREHLQLGAGEISDVQSWVDQWGMDPIYVVRFKVDERVLAERVAELGLLLQSSDIPTTSAAADEEIARETARLREENDALHWRPRWIKADWWQPPGLFESKTWSRQGNDWVPDDPQVRVRYDPQSGWAYLIVMYF